MVMEVDTGSGQDVLSVEKAFDPDEGFLNDGALTVGVHMSVNVKVQFIL